MVKTVEPEILAELARMERSGALKRYVDDGALCRMVPGI